MKRQILAFALVMTAFRLQAQVVTYTFDGLAPTTLAGQDNWVSSFVSGSPAFIGVGSGVNPTPRVTIGPNDFQSLSRGNNGNFSFTPFTGLETQALLQFDFRWDRADDGNGTGFRIGKDTNGDADLFYEGIGMRYQDGRFKIERGGGYMVSSDLRTNLNAGNVGDWYRVRLLVDFTAPSDFARLSYSNLTRGDSGFTEVVTSILSLNENFAGSQNPSDWNAFAITMNRGSEIDNLTIGQVPEPTSAALLAGSAVLLLRRRRRRKEDGVSLNG